MRPYTRSAVVDGPFAASATLPIMTAVYELPPDLFERARPVLGHPPADFAYIDAGLRGINPARVFVDDRDQPTAALMTRTYEYFAGGATGTALDAFIHDAPAELGVWDLFYGFVAVDPVWNEQIRSLLPGLEPLGRRSFRFDPARNDRVRQRDVQVPPEFRLEPLTAELAERTYGEMPGMVGWFWGGYDRYAEHGFGAVVLDGERPVSVCYSVAVGGGEANLGVMTLPDYRRRGLAAACCRACIAMAHERGLVATWDTDEPNVASANLALSLGFVEHEPFVEWSFPDRAKPQQSTGLWLSETVQDKIVKWTKQSRS
jgi:RimJ/RimL family protein N-acetyltransferase